MVKSVGFFIYAGSAAKGGAYQIGCGDFLLKKADGSFG